MKKAIILTILIWLNIISTYGQTIGTGSWEMKSTIDKKYGLDNCLTIKVNWILNKDGTYTRTHRGPSSNSDYKGNYSIDYKKMTISFYNSKLKVNDQLWIDILNLTYSIISFDDNELIVNECYCGMSEAGPSSDNRCITKYKKN